MDANNNNGTKPKLSPSSDSASSQHHHHSHQSTTSVLSRPSSSGYHTSNEPGSHQQLQSQQQQQQQAGANNDLNGENELFLKDCLTSVLEGQGVGLFKFNRVKRLMEDENYRNFVLSRLNTSLDKKLANDEEHIECVRVSKPVFKGMAKLLSAIIYGLEQTYANNGLGGMASAFQLLEIAHTHYCLQSETTASAAAAKIAGGGDLMSSNGGSGGGGGMSPMSERSNSPPFDRADQDTAGIANSPSSQFQNFASGFQIQSTGSIVAQLGI